MAVFGDDAAVIEINTFKEGRGLVWLLELKDGEYIKSEIAAAMGYDIKDGYFFSSGIIEKLMESKILRHNPQNKTYRFDRRKLEECMRATFKKHKMLHGLEDIIAVA